MNVAKWLLLACWRCRWRNWRSFIAGGGADRLCLGTDRSCWPTSLAGALVLRHAGGNHIARVRVAIGRRQLYRLAGRQPRRPHPVGRDSAVNSGVYHRCPGGFCCSSRHCGERWRGARAVRRRQRSDGVVDLGPSSGAACPTLHCPTGVDDEWTVNAQPAERARASLFPPRPYVSQPPLQRSCAVQGVVHVDDQWRPARPTRKISSRKLNVVAQYIKDFSFENPNAPRSLAQPARQQPRSTSRSMSTPRRWRTPTSRSCSSSKARRRSAARVLFALRADIRRRVPHPERAAGKPATRWC